MHANKFGYQPWQFYLLGSEIKITEDNLYKSLFHHTMVANEKKKI